MIKFLSVALLVFAQTVLAEDRIGSGGSSFYGEGGSQPTEEIMKACVAARGAREALASAYGSCDAPAAVKGGGRPADSMCESSPPQNPGSLAQVYNSPSECGKPCSPKPKYEQESRQFKISGDVIEPQCISDCSAYASVVAAKLGHRFSPNKDITAPTTTEELVKLISNKSESCWEEVSDGKLLPGDMCVYNQNGKGHVSLIDRISEGAGSCEYSIIESSGGDDAQYGGIRVVLKGGENGGGPVSDVVGRSMVGLSKDCVTKSNPAMKVARFNDKKPGCKGPVKKFRNEDCIDKCPYLGKDGEA